MMKLTFLGTSSGVPTKERNVSGMALALETGETFLFDCGEATQHQIQKSEYVKLGKVSTIFLTHMHGDHIFGLPGLLLSASGANPPDRKVVNLYGPLGIRKYLFTTLSLSDSHLAFKVHIYEIVPPEFSENTELLQAYEKSFMENHVDIHQGYGGGEGDIEEGAEPQTLRDLITGEFVKYNAAEQCYNLPKIGALAIKAAPIKHRVFCVGYALQEDNIPGKLDVEKAKKLGVKMGPLMGKLKAGADVTLENGTLIRAADCVGDEQPGRKVVILGDTFDATGITTIAQGCDVMTHETTLDDEQMELAIMKGHACPKMAASFAKSIGVKNLILTHFSARFDGESKEANSNTKNLKVLLEQARNEFGEKCLLAADFRTFEISRTGVSVAASASAASTTTTKQ